MATPLPRPTATLVIPAIAAQRQNLDFMVGKAVIAIVPPRPVDRVLAMDEMAALEQFQCNPQGHTQDP